MYAFDVMLVSMLVFFTLVVSKKRKSSKVESCEHITIQLNLILQQFPILENRPLVAYPAIQKYIHEATGEHGV
jgi:hypothetical protein